MKKLSKKSVARCLILLLADCLAGKIGFDLSQISCNP
jgi:hypothetical protein